MSIIQAVSFPGDTVPGRVFFDIHGENLKSLLFVDGGDRTHDPKIHGLSTTSFVKELEWGIINSPFDHLQKVNQ